MIMATFNKISIYAIYCHFTTTTMTIIMSLVENIRKVKN